MAVVWAQLDGAAKRQRASPDDTAISPGGAGGAVLVRAVDRTAIFDTLKCPICLDLYNDPTMLSGCGHTFCCDCITKHLQGRKDYNGQCPMCKKPARERDCIVAHVISNVVQAIKSAI